MAQGFCPNLLLHMREVAQSATPQFKMRPTGFFGSLIASGNVNALPVDAKTGHKKEVKVKYKTRYRIADTDTSRSCDNVHRKSYSETTASLDKFRQLAINIDDETIAQYCEQASRSVVAGQPATAFMNEFVEDVILGGANALIGAVNRDLVEAQKSKFGSINIGGTTTDTSSSPITVNFNDDTSVNKFDEGMTKILGDYQDNDGSERPIIVGGGLFHKYAIQQRAKGLAQNGINTSIFNSDFEFWYDRDASNDWTDSGAKNNIGIFEPNSVQLIEYMRNRGHKAGVKGTSTFGIIPIPMVTNNGIIPVNFDFQWKYYDCPTTLTDAYSGDSIEVDRGWSMIVSKEFGLFNLPTGAYESGDELEGNNGTYRYKVTNA